MWGVSLLFTSRTSGGQVLLARRMQSQGLIPQLRLSKEAAARPCASYFEMCIP